MVKIKQKFNNIASDTRENVINGKELLEYWFDVIILR